MKLTLEQAQKSKELNLKMNVAVVDAGANLMAFGRM